MYNIYVISFHWIFVRHVWKVLNHGYIWGKNWKVIGNLNKFCFTWVCFCHSVYGTTLLQHSCTVYTLNLDIFLYFLYLELFFLKRSIKFLKWSQPSNCKGQTMWFFHTFSIKIMSIHRHWFTPESKRVVVLDELLIRRNVKLISRVDIYFI